MHYTSKETPAEEKARLSDKLSKQTSEFLARGGKILQIPRGKSGMEGKVLRVPILQGREK